MSWGSGSGSGTMNIVSNGTMNGSGSEKWCTYNGQALQYQQSTNSCYYQGAWYPATTPGVTVQSQSYTFVGTVSTTGQISGSWAAGYQSGGLNGLPSGSSLSGAFTMVNGSTAGWTGS